MEESIIRTLTQAEVAVAEAIALGVGEELARLGVPDRTRFLVRATARDDGGLDVVVHDGLNKGAAIVGARMELVTSFDVQTGMEFRAVGVDLGGITYTCTHKQTE